MSLARQLEGAHDRAALPVRVSFAGSPSFSLSLSLSLSLVDDTQLDAR